MSGTKPRRGGLLRARRVDGARAFFVCSLPLSSLRRDARPASAAHRRNDRSRSAQAKRTATVSVYIGKSEDVRTDPSFVEVTVGDPEVADVNPLTDRSISILGKKNGTTRVSVYAEGKKLIGVFDVEVVYDTSLLQTELRRRFPYAGIKISAVNGRIMLSGTAPDGPTVDKAVQIARQFGPDVINSVDGAAAAAGDAGGALRRSHPSGRPRTRHAVERVRPAQPRPTSATAASARPSLPPSYSSSHGRRCSAGVLSPASRRLSASCHRQDDRFGAWKPTSSSMRWSRRALARSLAEPNLVALSGDTASFLAGGEYPIPVPGGTLGQVTIDYKRYGVGLAFTPTVLSGGLINLKIEPEVSQLDTSHPVQLAGISVPPLIVRRASTTVELRDGQSFVIGGLLQSVGQSTIEQLPWLGDVPVLGALFRSTSYQKQRNRSCHHRHAAAGPPGAARRRHQDAARRLRCRPTTSICSSWARPRSRRPWRG